MVEFTLPMKAFSVNKMNYRDVRFKTAEFKDWFSELCERLQGIKELHELGDDFRAKGGVFCIWITISYPPHIYFTKSHQVSAKTFDCTNVEKPIVDAIFRETMHVDDRYLVKCISEKKAGASNSIFVRLEHYTDSDI